MDSTFSTTLQKVVNMTRDAKLRDRVRQLGLNVINVMWEDTARTPGSVWGPNITDMTLQVRHPDRPDKTELLPVIRHPNFTDKTADVPLDLVKIKVGNETGGELRVVSLREYLTNLNRYVSYPRRLHSQNQPLVTEKDTHVLVSAQACFLPIPKRGKCEFNPVLFNYQSRRDNPAVLTILIATEGSSATALDNSTDKASWGQNVYFNHDGQKTCLTGERLSDYKENRAQDMARQEGISVEEARSRVSVAEDVNMVMVVQVPLKHAEQSDRSFGESDEMDQLFCDLSAPAMRSFAETSDMEDAVIGHGEGEGEHPETGGYKLERDDRYPIRLTVQFYKATSNGVINYKDLENIRQCIDAAYESADYIGSLVVGTLEKGRLGMGEARPTQPAPSEQPVLSPPKDFLQVVNPFKKHHRPKTGD